MSRRSLGIRLSLITAIAVMTMSLTVDTERGRGPVRMFETSGTSVRQIDRALIGMERARELKTRSSGENGVLPGRIFTRLDQFHRGVRVWGGEAIRETDSRGVTLSVVTHLYQGIDISTEPVLTADEARERIEQWGGAKLGPSKAPTLVVYPTAEGAYRLAYTQTVATASDVRRYFIDANTGARIDDYSVRLAQSAVGTGIGVLGDTKKISTYKSGTVFVSEDRMRPAPLRTYDLRGNYAKLLDWLNGIGYLYHSDLATDDDNAWTDGATVDAHVFAGWTYDYFYKRFNRHGLDGSNSRVLNIVHPAYRSDLQHYKDTGKLSEVGDFYCNAGYYGDGVMVFGEGVPPGWVCGDMPANFWSGALDIVAHEYGHGITEFTSDLDYRGEPRSLNEAYSDIVATSVEFYYRGARANYTMGDDTIPGGNRSLSNPQAFGDVDHYSKRKPFKGGEYENCTIAGHAFYLAIEGGTNRTSGMSVQGVGGANREQIEKAFYLGFTSYLTANATFGQARAATIRAAQELYGAGSAAARAITQAWDAVGVQ